MSGNNSNPDDDWVRLNVGGKVFETTKDTLSKYPESFLARLVNGGLPSTQDKYGAYRIDRSYEHFDTILNYFRNGTLNFESNEKAVKDLLCEADFYNIQPLVDEIHKAIKLCLKRTEVVIVKQLVDSIHMKNDTRCSGTIIFSEVQEDYEVLQALKKKFVLYTKDDIIDPYGMNDEKGTCYIRQVSDKVLMRIELVLRNFGFVEEQNHHTFQRGGTYYYTWKFARTLSK
ncbi:BTB/POZ domain-containing protein [Ditylenchus destructor]|uniref:BTB/POZ domain-containing protein n=1 Tax=Ditylenchus destructor TaxID=166010 RepID=A0AAD4MTB9_9BILA|nr:BTB/POZ domain-containing protein [Ditylenchus destructor]